MIKKILFGLFLGIIATIVCMQYDPHTKQVIGKGFKQAFEQALDCRFEGTLKNINFFWPTIEFEDVIVTPSQPGDAGWAWQAQTYKTQFSWLHLFFQGALDLRASLSGVHSFSELKGSDLAIMAHIQRMIIGTADIPMVLKYVGLENAVFVLQDTDRQTTTSVSWSSQTKRMGAFVRTHVALSDGSFFQNGASLISALQGQLSIDIDESNPGIPEIVAKNTIHFSCAAPGIKPITCFVNGSWQQMHGNFSVQTDMPDVSIDAVDINIGNAQAVAIKARAHAPLESIAAHLQPLFKLALPIAGTAHINGQTEYADGVWRNTHGSLEFTDVSCNSIPLCNAATITVRHDDALHGTLAAQRGELACSGNWSWNLNTKNGTLSFSNSTPFLVPYIDAQGGAGDCTCTIAGDADGNYSGSYALALRRAGKSKAVAGSFKGSLTEFAAQGLVDDAGFELELNAQPAWHLQKFALHDIHNKPMVACRAEKENNKKIIGSIDFSFIKKLAEAYVGDYLQGHGLLEFALELDSWQHLKGHLHFHKGSIRLPQTYNVLEEFTLTGEIDGAHNKATVHDATLVLNKGTASSKGAVITWKDFSEITYAYVPLILDNCLLTIKKDVFVSLSGNLLLTHTAPEIPLIKGHIIIDRSQIKENIFSLDFQKNFVKNNAKMALPHCRLDCTIETKDALRIKTELLEMSAHGCLHLTQTLQNPALSGAITCNEGILQFPYKPLYMSKATLALDAHNIENSAIELIARNTIKNYEIILSITGTLQDHHINLSASPALTENQIVSLLFVGSQEESLNAVVPALVMENLKTVLFESEHSPLKLTGSFKQLLAPLKKIHLVPRFTDQTGRGGLRGAIEIEVNDRVRALIQKNFSLTEDTRFELEYLLSDDISVRGIRDERRDVNAEVEMRWKF
jgi:hypothetical protein